jgi:hypothetical protein
MAAVTNQEAAAWKEALENVIEEVNNSFGVWHCSSGN